MLTSRLGDDLARLAAQQDGVLTRAQLTTNDISEGFVAAQLAAIRWQAVARSVIVLHNGTPTRRQWMWVAVLDAGLAALASHTALELAGSRHDGNERRLLHLVVPRGAKCAQLAGVAVHESRRFVSADVYGGHALPRVSPARAAVDAGAWQQWPRFAAAMLATVVQQRLTTVDRLRAELDRAGKVRHRAYMTRALDDIAGGAEALGEIDVARLCRQYGLMAPHRQVRRRDRSGRVRYLDCEWTLPDGRVVVLEVDGSHHMNVKHWEQDMRRERRLVLDHRTVLRASNQEVRLDGGLLAADLVAAGVPRTR